MKVERRVIGFGGGPEEAFGNSIDEDEFKTRERLEEMLDKWFLDFWFGLYWAYVMICGPYVHGYFNGL